MRIVLTIACIVCSSLGGNAAIGKEVPVVLEPSSQWIVDYANDSCALRRKFGQGSQALFLELEQFSPTSSLKLSIASPLLDSSNKRRLISLRIGPDERRHSKSYAFLGKLGDGTPTLLIGGIGFLGLPPKDVQILPHERPAKADQLAYPAEDWILDQFGQRPITLRMGHMAPPMRAMAKCLDQLLETWGLDPELARRISSPPVPRFRGSDWFVPDDMIGHDKSGIVNFRLMVEADGKISSCHVQGSAGSQSFRNETCDKALARARLRPARDKDGKPVRWYYNNVVSWLGSH